MIYAIVVVLVLILDQGLKFWTVSNIALNTGEVPLIDGIVHLTYVRNYGAAFSILQNTRWLLVALTVVFVGVVIYALASDMIRSPFGRWSALLVMAGAIGNGIDRVFLGYVVDMIEVEFITFPVFNVADMFVTVFGILFCFYIVFHKNPEPEEQEEKVPLAERIRRREPEQELPRGGDIEMVRKASVHRPAEPRRPERPVRPAEERPAPRRFDPANPFAEWEDTPAPEQRPAAPAADAAVAGAAAPAAARPAYIDDAPAEKPAASAAKKPASDDEFDIDDILAEFKD